MKNRLVVINNTKKVIQPSAWDKKLLAEYHLELSGLCGFGCRYCSSNATPWMRVHRGEFIAATIQQQGERLTPKDNPELAYVWRDDIVEQLRRELAGKKKSYGTGKTIALSQSTDPLSPVVDPDTFEAVLRLLIEKTSFRIRILTKNALIGSDRWIAILKEFGSRVIVSLSTGTLDAEFSSLIEIGTSTPAARLRALRNLQDAGIPTFGMLCPIFPQVLDTGRLNELIDAIRPDLCEHVWAEPYNDRANWEIVREGHEVGTPEYDWFERAFGSARDPLVWSAYATNLYKALRLRAEDDGWTEKLRYMLYESDIQCAHVRSYCDLRGVLLQSVDDLGRSKNPEFRALQDKLRLNIWDRVDHEAHAADPEPAFLRDVGEGFRRCDGIPNLAKHCLMAPENALDEAWRLVNEHDAQEESRVVREG